jgi:hypothetical protein
MTEDTKLFFDGMGECVLYEFDDIEVIGNIHEKQALMENMERVK